MYYCRALPKARVLYCSATGVTDVKNMAFMERMGLWGEATAFNSYEAFLDTIQKKGLGKFIVMYEELEWRGCFGF